MSETFGELFERANAGQSGPVYDAARREIESGRADIESVDVYEGPFADPAWGEVEEEG